jgi:hypothetical protein
VLVWIRRNAADTIASYQKRGEAACDSPEKFKLALQRAEHGYKLWPWEKITLDYEDVASAVGLFNPPELAKPAKVLKVGFDLDGCVYAYPELFGPMIAGLHAAGHKCYLTTWHSIAGWEQVHRHKVAGLGIDPDVLDSSLLHWSSDVGKWSNKYHWKASVIDQLDFAYDDEWSRVQPLTKTPVFAPAPAPAPGLPAPDLLPISPPALPGGLRRWPAA